jgi:uncharacterized protein (TIGR00369 family)
VRNAVKQQQQQDWPMSHTPFVLTPELEQAVHGFFERIPFNRLLGITISEVSARHMRMEMPMRDDLIGNFAQGILHGGAIATVLDVCGGAMALIGAFEQHQKLSVSERMTRLSRLGTVDLRIDYLRPGRGTHFSATATTLRAGSKVAVIRSELHNEQGVLVAVGTGTYIYG